MLLYGFIRVVFFGPIPESSIHVGECHNTLAKYSRANGDFASIYRANSVGW